MSFSYMSLYGNNGKNLNVEFSIVETLEISRYNYNDAYRNIRTYI